MTDHTAHARACRATATFAAVAMSLAGAAGQALAAKAPSTYCGSGVANCIDSPMSGAVTPTSAMVWVHLNQAASVRVRYENVKANTWTNTGSLVTAVASDNTGKFALDGLKAATTYAYQVGIVQAGGTETWSPKYFFRTTSTAPQSLAFSVLSDFANALVTSPALRTAAAASNDFMLFIGDMDHRNPAADKKIVFLPGDPRVLADMRSMHQNMRNKDYPIGADVYNGLLASTSTHPQTPFYYSWDDHDYCSNNVGAGCLFRDFAFQAYRENYVWAADSGLNNAGACQSVNQHFSYGTLLDVIMLDARSGRVQSGDTPTMLGTCQLDWLLATLRQSTATWKFLISPVPFNQTTKTYDAWGAFPAERQQILDQIAAADIRNVIVLSGDIHSGGAFDDGTHSGLPEFSVPHANMPFDWVNTYCQPIYVSGHVDHMNDEPGTWTVGSMTAPNTVPTPTCLGKDYPGKLVTIPTAAPYPLDGVGAAGFVRVELTPTTATVRVLGEDGVARSGVLADGSAAPLSMQFTAR